MHIIGRRIAAFLGVEFATGPAAAPDPAEAEAALADFLATIPEVSR